MTSHTALNPPIVHPSLLPSTTIVPTSNTFGKMVNGKLLRKIQGLPRPLSAASLDQDYRNVPTGMRCPGLRPRDPSFVNLGYCPFRDEDWIKSFIQVMFRFWFLSDLLLLLSAVGLLAGTIYFRPGVVERCITSGSTGNQYFCSTIHESEHYYHSIVFLVVHILLQLVRYKCWWKGDGQNGLRLCCASAATVLLFATSLGLYFVGYEKRSFLFLPIVCLGYNFNFFIFLQFVSRRDEIFVVPPEPYQQFLNFQKVPKENDGHSLDQFISIERNRLHSNAQSFRSRSDTGFAEPNAEIRRNSIPIGHYDKSDKRFGKISESCENEYF